MEAGRSAAVMGEAVALVFLGCLALFYVWSFIRDIQREGWIVAVILAGVCIGVVGLHVAAGIHPLLFIMGFILFMLFILMWGEM